VAEKTGKSGLATWFVAFVVPPAVAGGLGREFVAHRPDWGVAIFVAYEAAVAVGGFFAVVARDVSARWQKRLADRVDLFLQRKGPRFERRYREVVMTGLRFIDVKGLATVGAFTPELDAVFVDVALLPRPPQQIKPGVLPDLDDGLSGRRALTEFLGRPRPAILAIVGGPGSGKTTLLRHTARQACLKPHRRRDLGRDLPILLYLRDHAVTITEDPTVSIPALLGKSLGTLGMEEPPGWFEQKLRDGQCLVMLDGLDEVARREDRVQVAAWAEAQIRQYPGNDFVISSRPQGYQTAPVAGAEVVQACGFTSAQVRLFVQGWYRAVERHGTGTDGPEAEARAQEGAADLLRRLEQAPALWDLTVNPLLLTMIANVHRYRGALPGSRADLYSEICQVMLWRRQDAKNLTTLPAGDKKEAILCSLAYAMMRGRATDLSRADVLAEITPALRRVSRQVTPEGFLADASSNGLLIERETEQYAFSHKTFQEYLAAAYIREKGLVNVLTDAVNDDWWRETTLLYAAGSDADPIVDSCLKANTVAALSLAWDCADQDSDLDPILRDRLDALLAQASVASAAADPARRRLIAAVMLSRHLRQRLRTTDGAHVFARPISNDIYQLFLADTGYPLPDAHPSLLMQGPATAVGMRGSDAIAFVQWANSLSAGHSTYRLATKAEHSDLAEQRQRLARPPDNEELSFWTQSHEPQSSIRPQLWVRAGVPHPHTIGVASMDAAIAGDLIHSISAQMAMLIPYYCESGDAAIEHHPSYALLPDIARDIARDIAKGSTHYSSLDSSFKEILHGAMDPDRPLHHAIARNQAITLARALGFVLNRAFAAKVMPSIAISLELWAPASMDMNPHSYFSRSALDPAVGHPSMKQLSDAIERGFWDTRRPDDWLSVLTAAYAEIVGFDMKYSLTCEPETLNSMLSQAVAMFRESLLQRDSASASPSQRWLATLAVRLEQHAATVFSRAEPITAEKATAIRLAALCLAQEEGMREVGHMFRHIAAGITLLEDRAAGAQPATEAIMLAVE
jgi:hypothetical protein